MWRTDRSQSKELELAKEHGVRIEISGEPTRRKTHRERDKRLLPFHWHKTPITLAVPNLYAKHTLQQIASVGV